VSRSPNDVAFFEGRAHGARTPTRLAERRRLVDPEAVTLPSALSSATSPIRSRPKRKSRRPRSPTRATHGQDARDEVRADFSREASIEREHANCSMPAPGILESLVERAISRGACSGRGPARMRIERDDGRHRVLARSPSRCNIMSMTA